MIKKFCLFCLLPLFCCVLLFSSCGKKRQKVEITSGPALMGLKEAKCDVGEVKRNASVSHDYVFYNLGSEPLVINEVITDCNCLQAKYTKEPVQPGESGEITLTVIGSRLQPGYFQRGAIVYSNANNNPMNLLIVGNSAPLKR
jgi:hypothetical protein